jgi:pentafunctional AROM polypeptide
MMSDFGIHVTRPSPTTYCIPQGSYQSPGTYVVEPDASSATYPLAMAAIGGRCVRIPHLGNKSLQGDAQFAALVLAPMGCQVDQTKQYTQVRGPPIGELQALGVIDFEPMTDAFLTGAVLASVARGPKQWTEIRGIANQRVKECNRITAMIDEFKQYGIQCDEFEDGLRIFPIQVSPRDATSCSIQCYDDHRVAMSFSVLASIFGGVIEDRRCVDKTWPAWWDTFSGPLGVSCSGMENGKLIGNNDQLSPKKQTTSIILIGMRGVGKSTLGSKSAPTLGYRWLDLDHLFETHYGPVAQFVKANNWEKFRELELELFQRTIEDSKEMTIISTGGGIVETEKGRNLLSACNLHVVHVVRSLDAIKKSVSYDPSRPVWSESIEEVWARRKPWYMKCSSFDFYLPHVSGETDWDAIIRQFSGLHSRMSHPISLDRLTGMQLKVAMTASSVSSFVSLTCGRVQDMLSALPRILDGTNAVELRVDTLDDHSLEGVADAYFTLTQATALPVILTVRTTSHGGNGSRDALNIKELIVQALRWGIAAVDLEIDHPFVYDLVPLCRKSGTLIIASFHDPQGELSWNRNKDVWYEHYQVAQGIGDIIKLIGKANSVQDNFDLQNFIQGVQSENKPLIALNMGDVGKLSRVGNPILTPITHPLLPRSAAPGQISLCQLHQMQSALGWIPSKRFYLFGSPISQSFSPLIHSTAFQTLGLPFTYHLHEVNTANEISEIIRQKDFGGASITIPLKEQIHSCIDVQTPAAQAIGAINTIYVRKEGKESIQYVGDNTDYIAIYKLIQPKLQGSASGGKCAMVLGAGGTCRAALYALSLVPQIKKIWIINRTLERAQAVHSTLRAFLSKDAAVSCGTWDTAVVEPVHVLISTVPRSVVDGYQSTLPNWIHKEHLQVLVDLVYGAPTGLSIAAKEVLGSDRYNAIFVPGHRILLEQAYEQCERWTGLPAPKQSMDEALESALPQYL